MGRLINIDRLCNDLMERWSIADKKKEDLIRAVMADVVTPIVVSQPTVDAVPIRHGRWINGKCDKCGGHAPFWAMATTYYPSEFCPNCGAKMDGKDGDA